MKVMRLAGTGVEPSFGGRLLPHVPSPCFSQPFRWLCLGEYQPCSSHLPRWWARPLRDVTLRFNPECGEPRLILLRKTGVTPDLENNRHYPKHCLHTVDTHPGLADRKLQNSHHKPITFTTCRHRAHRRQSSNTPSCCTTTPSPRTLAE